MENNLNKNDFNIKKEKINSIIDTLEELLDIDFDEAQEFLQNLDEIFWKDNFYSISLINTMRSYFYEMDDYVLEGFIPSYFWEDRKNALDAIEIIAKSECFNICSFVPSYLWEDEQAALYIMTLDYTGLRYASDKLNNYRKIVLYALSNLEEKIEKSYNNFPALPWDNRKYLKLFMKDISKSLKNDKEFILQLLSYNYFINEFDVIYDWIDEELWDDKEFIIAVAAIDEDILNRMSNKLKTDVEFLEELEKVMK